MLFSSGFALFEHTPLELTLPDDLPHTLNFLYIVNLREVTFKQDEARVEYHLSKADNFICFTPQYAVFVLLYQKIEFNLIILR